MPFNRPLIVILLLAVLVFFAVQRFGLREAPSLSRSRIIMGTVVEITALGKDQSALEQAVSAAFAEMARIEALMTPHQESSDVARLSAADQQLVVAPETAEVIALGLKVGSASGGALDMTLGRLKTLWGIESETPRVPSREELAAALRGSGPQALHLDGRLVVKADPALAVDLGAIAKGFAVDRAVAVLKEAGIVQASVNAGGDIFLLGDHGGRRWRIGIQHPRHEKELLATLNLANVAVVTSGDYERFFERDGVRYHHIFDPRTGLPAGRCQSATVVAPNAALADALSTAVFVLGPEEGLSLLAKFPGSEALVVAADGSVRLSDGLQEGLEWP